MLEETLMKISCMGTGYVGLTIGACLADLGHNILCVDIDKEKIEKLKQGEIPFYEPGLKELVLRNREKGKLDFTTSIEEGIKSSGVIFNCVGTPSKEDGSADLQYVFKVAENMGRFAEGYKLLVNKSTVPPGTARKCFELIRGINPDSEVEVVSNPEFLKEGAAVHDFEHPDKIVVGAVSEKAFNLLKRLYMGRMRTYIPLIETDWATAEVIKYINNCKLAARISFMNEAANICDKMGADVKVVSQAIGMDQRIGPKFLNAGVGYGGSCLLGDSLVMIKKESGKIYPQKLKKVFDLLNKKQKLKVLSFDTKKKKVVFNKIIKATKRKFRGNLITVKTRMNKKLVCTDDHPFVVFDAGEFKTKLAKDLTTVDKIPSYLGFPESTNHNFIDVINKLNNDEFDFEKIRVRPVGKKFSLVKGVINQSFTAGRKRDILRSDCMNLNEFLKIEENISEDIRREDIVLFTSKGNTTYCPAMINFNKDFCTFLGYYLSEGNIHYEKGLRGIRARIQIHFNISEEEYINEVKNILNNLNIRFSIREQPKNSTKSFVISSRILAFVLNNILKCGADSYSADVPGEIFSLNNDLKLAFLRSIFRGDGHIAFPKNTNSVVYDFGSISYNLVHKMILLFHSLNIVPSYKTSRSQKSTGPAHFFRISTKNQILQLKNFKDEETQEKVRRQLITCKNIQPCGFKRSNEGFCTTNIKEIGSRFSEEAEVYSLEVEDSNTFVTDFGLIVHNCFPKDVRALIAAAEDVGYDAKLLKEVDSLNERQKLVLVGKIKGKFGDLGGKVLTVWGLSFKPKTDDMREAPSIVLINELLGLGAKVNVYDPVAMENAKKMFGDALVYSNSMEESVLGSEGIILMTEWKDFRNANLLELGKKMKRKIVFDGRNIYTPEVLREEGFEYVGVGRK